MFRKKPAINPLIEKGRAYWKKNKFKEAIDCFTTALESEPKNAEVYAFRAMAYQDDISNPENLDKSVLDFSMALQHHDKRSNIIDKYKLRLYALLEKLPQQEAQPARTNTDQAKIQLALSMIRAMLDLHNASTLRDPVDASLQAKLPELNEQPSKDLTQTPRHSIFCRVNEFKPKFDSKNNVFDETHYHL